MASHEQSGRPSEQGDEPIHCVSCTITFLSQSHLDAHLPCTNATFDLSRVKTEVEEEESMSSSAIDRETKKVTDSMNNFSDAVNIKKEIKGEILDPSDVTEISQLTFTSANHARNSKNNPVYSRRGRCASGTGEVHGGRRPKLARKSDIPSTYIIVTTTPNEDKLQIRPAGGVTIQEQARRPPRTLTSQTKHPSIGKRARLRQIKHAVLKKKAPPNILPKIENTITDSGIKINGVFYTRSTQIGDNMAPSKMATDIVSVPVSAVVSTPNVIKTIPAVSNTLSLNSLASTSTLPVLQNQSIINPLSFGSVMFGNSILPNVQQNPIILGNTGPVFNTVQNISNLQSNTLIPKLQHMHLSQPLQNILPRGQNMVQQNNIQAATSMVSSGVSSSATSVKNSVVSEQISTVSTPNPVSPKIPVLVGNQIILMGVPSSTVQADLKQGNNSNADSLPVSPLQASARSACSQVTQPLSLSSVIPLSAASASPVPSQVTDVNQIISQEMSQKNADILNASFLPILAICSGKKSSLSQAAPTTKVLLPKVVGCEKSQSQSQNSVKKQLQDQAGNECKFPGSTAFIDLSEQGTELDTDTVTVDTMLKSAVSCEEKKKRSDSQSQVIKMEKLLSNLKCIAMKGKKSISRSNAILPRASPLSSVNSPIPLAFKTSTTTSSSQSATSLNTDINKYILSPTGQLANPSSANIVPPTSLASMIHQTPILFQPQLQHPQQATYPYINSILNLGGSQVPFYPNPLGLQETGFTLDGNSGQNVWILNLANNQPIVIGNNASQTALVLGTPVMGGVTANPNFNSAHSVTYDACSKKAGSAMNIFAGTGTSSPTIVSMPIEEKIKLEDNCHSLNTGHTMQFSEEEKKTYKTVKEMLEEKNVSRELTGSRKKVDSVISGTGVEQIKYDYGLSSQEIIECADSSEVPLSSTEVLASVAREMKLVAGYTTASITNVTHDSIKKKRLLSDYYDPKTGLLQMELTSQNSKVATPIKSSAVKPKSLIKAEFTTFINESTDSANPSKNMFLGPLTKKELENIIKNPSELEKYIKAPHEQVLVASKAIAVPTSSLPISEHPLECGKKVLHQELPPYPGAQISSITGNTLPFLLSPTVLGTTKVVMNTSECIKSICPKSISENEVGNVSEEMGKKYVLTVVPGNPEIIKSNAPADNAHLQPHSRARKRKFSNEEKKDDGDKCLTSGKNLENLMKLTFIGDIHLLKDALRKCTVTLHRLPVDSSELVAAIDSYKRKRKQRKKSDVDLRQPGHSKDKQHKQDGTSDEEQNRGGVVAQKQWVPLEVVGDLTIKGKLLDSSVACNEDLHSQGKRRSTRIKAMPKLDYADLERLPFQDLDDSDSEFEIHHEDSFKIVTEINEEECLTPETLKVSHNPQYSDRYIETKPSCDNGSLVIHKNVEVPVLNSTSSSKPPSVESQSPTKGQTGNKLPTSPLSVDEKNNCESLSARSSPVHVKPEEEIISKNNPESEAHQLSVCSDELRDNAECYYSSESESDIFDPNLKFANKAEKKKYIQKRHSETTMFLIKHPGKFHSVDEEGEYYCSVCNNYKTNGIFSLTKHLKTHL